MERWLPWLAVMALVSAGCGGKTDTPTTESSAAASGEASASANVPPPEAAVTEFLNAVKRGDDEKSAQMLTPLARQKTAELDMVVAPPGSDTATFTVGEVEMVADEVAHVACTWTDVGENGQPRDEKIIWMLRREPEGWRIAGMATELFDGELPLLLDFENPQDMLEKERLAQEEILRRQQAAGASAAGPVTPEQAAAEAMKQNGPAAPVRQ
jgi:hypothetical protein